MANSVISTVIHDGARNAIIEVTGILDTSDVTQTDITTIANLVPVPTTVRIEKIQFAIEDGISCMLWWHDTAGTTLIVPLTGRGKLTAEWFGGYNNPKNAGYTGNIQMSTAGFSGVKHFSLLLELIKQGV